MYDHPNSLFAGISAFEVVRDVFAKAMSRLENFSENTILTVPTDDLINDLLTMHHIDIPELREDQTWVDEQEVINEVTNRGYDIFSDRGPGTAKVRSYVINFHVPFIGDRNVFNLSPSNRTIPGPKADIREQELIISVPTKGLTQEQIRQRYDNTMQSIKDHLTTLISNLSNVTRQIEQPARESIERRKTQLLQSKDLTASLGFPMKRRSDAVLTYKAPDVRRKLLPVKQQTVAPFKPEPTLEDKDYQNILNVMENMTKVMERSPHAFHGMGEEDIRQHFLVQLNGQYEGQATGETFNFHGKTDILVRSEGRNIFIAECKIWYGEKIFLETIDQLISYLSWRDTKTALLIFNKNKNLSSVIQTIKEAIEKHPHKKHGPNVEGETRLKYIMGNPNDHFREIIMTVMVFDIPTLD